MDRLGRNLVDLRKTVGELTSRKIGVRFVKENLTLIGDDSPMATLLLKMMGSFAEFEVRGAGNASERELNWQSGIVSIKVASAC